MNVLSVLLGVDLKEAAEAQGMCKWCMHVMYYLCLAAAAGNRDPYVDQTDDKKENETPSKKPAADSQPTPMDTDEDAEKKEVIIVNS